MKKSSYDFNSKIYIFLLTLMIVYSFYYIIKAIITNDINFLTISIYLVAIIAGVYVIYRIRKKQNTFKDVMEKGIKVPGVIVRPEKEKTYDTEGSETSYYLYIKYIDPKTNQLVEFKTDKLSFNPFKRIKSTNCNVYIYNDIVLAEDFELTNDKSESIFQEKKEVIMPTEKKGLSLLIVLAVIMLIVAAILLITSIV